ncbi:hypothetical protein, partial [Bacteroides heparinolyticus]
MFRFLTPKNKNNMCTRTFLGLLFAQFILCFSANAQSTPEALLNQLPDAPSVNCIADRAEIDRFSDKIHKVKEIIQQVVERIHANTLADIKENNNKIISDAMKQSGLQKADVQRLQESDGSEEQGRNVAEKVINSQYGISLNELENISQMSDAEQEKWAQQYAEQMKSKTPQELDASIKKGENSKRLFELSNRQKALGEIITERMNRIGRLFKTVEQQDSIETLTLEEKLRPLKEQLCSGVCTPAEAARSKAAEKQIHMLKVRFCEKMSPQQTDAILQYQTTLKFLLPYYRELTDVQNKIARLQCIGEVIPQDLSCYTAIDAYATTLLNAHKYWVGKFNK